jgi:hypothetical protein
VEQDDAKIAESWWSGTAGRGADEVAAPPAAAEDPTDWDSLRQKFVASHAPPSEQQGSRQRRVLRPLLLFVALVTVLAAGASLLVLAGHPTMSAGIRDTIGALLDEASSPGVTAAKDEPVPAGPKKNRARRGSAPVAAMPKAEAPINTAIREEAPFTIEVIDRNRRTVVHAYDNPLEVAVGTRPLVTDIAPEVPSLVIEETIGPGGAVSRTTNVGGSVVLSGIVATDGRMRDLRVVRGPAEFVPAAMEAIRRWRFTVLQQDGIPVERPARVTVNMAIKADGAASTTTK